MADVSIAVHLGSAGRRGWSTGDLVMADQTGNSHVQMHSTAATRRTF